MALSYQNYTGDNVTDTFSIPFTYTDTSEISVTVDGVAQTGLTFPSASTVQLTSPPATSTLVQVRRATDLTARSIDYVSGSVLTEEDLDNANIQVFHASQEAVDTAGDAVGLDSDDKMDAQSKVIKNVADPVSAQDAVTKNYLENTWLTLDDKAQLNSLNTANLDTVANDITNVNTVATNIANVNTVAGVSGNVTTVATDIANVNTVAADLNEPVSEIDTVANNITNVNTVGGISTDVTTVAGIASDVTAVAADATDIGTVSTNIANVNTVAGISSDVTTVSGISGNVTSVANDATDIGTVASNIANVNTVAGISANVSTVAADQLDIGTVATNIASVNTVAANNTNVSTVAGISADVTAVAGISGDIQDVQDKLVQIQAVADDLQEVTSEIDTVAASIANVDTVGGAITNVNTVATNVANVNTVAGISSNVTTVAGVAANVTTVAGISSDVTAVAADATDIGTVATNLAGTDTIGTVATNIANVNSVGGSISNVNTVASNISSVNDFADKYRIGASDPTTDNDEGDLFYNTTSDTLKVYTGTAWEQGVTAGSGFLPTTGGSLTGDVSFGDNNKAIFGASSDLQIYHDGLNSYIYENGSGSLRVRATEFDVQQLSNGNSVIKSDGSSAQLLENGTLRLETTSSGIDVTGTVTADDAVYVEGASPRLQIQDTDGTLQYSFLQQSAGTTTLRLRNDTSNGSFSVAGYGAGTTTTRFNIATNGDISFYDNTGVTQGLFWDASTQRLGLGTTSPTNALHISSSDGETVLLSNSNASGNSQIKFDGATDFQIGTGQASSGFANKFFLYDATNAATRMVVDSNGNVGIGTASPSEELTVSKSDDARISITSSGTGKAAMTGLLEFDGNDGRHGYIGPVGGVMRLNTDGGYDIMFQPGGTEKVRFTSTGNVGIGTSSPIAQSKLTVAGGAGSISVTGSDGNFAAGGQRSFIDFAGGKARVGGTGGGSTGTTLGLYVGTGLEAVSVTAAGNVGIGTSSPSARLHLKTPAGDNCDLFIEDSTFSPNIRMYSGGTNINSSIFYGSGAGTTALQFRQITAGAGITGANTERMRIDTDGNLLVGKTSSSLSTAGCSMKGSANVIQSTRASGPALEINRLTSDGEVAKFYRETVAKGSISVNSSGTTYNTTSDIRLKTDIAPIADATDKLMAMNAVSHKWKAEPDADAVVGFIAQEMAEIVPEAVSKGKDEDDMWSMDYGRITPVLVAALQDAHKKIEQLEQRIADMEAK